jgi:hypothetical protein
MIIDPFLFHLIDFQFFNAIQVCYDLNADNLDRELNGATEALALLNLKKGKIITVNQKDRFEKDGFVLEAIPCHEFLLF